jgi:hypothetical protein
MGVLAAETMTMDSDTGFSFGKVAIERHSHATQID